MEKYVTGFKKFASMLIQGDIKHNADTFIDGAECCPSEFGLVDGKKTFCDKGDCPECWREALKNLIDKDEHTVNSTGENCLFSKEEHRCLDCDYNRHGSTSDDYTSMCTASGELVQNSNKACENFKKVITKELFYDDNHKFTVKMESSSNNTECRKCLCKQCANGCSGLVCGPLCDHKMKVVHCTDFDDDDDWY